MSRGEIRQMLRRNDSAPKVRPPGVQTYGKRGHALLKSFERERERERRLSAREVRVIDPRGFLASELAPLSRRYPVNLSIRDGSICPVCFGDDRSSGIDRPVDPRNP